MSGRASTSDEEEDYMSPALLGKLPDIRPGVHGREMARRHQLENEREAQKRAPNRRELRRELEESRRTEALATPVGDDNKGFNMLVSMGFKPGQSLGKRAGLTEPIPIDVKSDRKGLGHQAALKRKAESILEEHRIESGKRKAAETQLLGDYRSRKRDAALAKRTDSDLMGSQKACCELDQKEGLETPARLWFWPPGAVPEDKDEEGEPIAHDYSDELEPAWKLAILAHYLRSSHRYCLWCGHAFPSEEEMESTCPGMGREAHEEMD